MNVVILAGDQKNTITTDEGISNKALIKIYNKCMIEYVIDTFRQSKYIDKIAVVGPVDKLGAVIGDKVDFLIDSKVSIIENGMLGLECFRDEKEVLISTSDIPMITVEAIDHFITQSREKDADLCYPIVNKKDNDLRYPEVKRTYARLWEGRFTGGNIFYFNPEAKDRCKDFVEKMFSYRKNPAKMAGVLGTWFLLRLALGILTLNAVQRKCERLMGIKGAAIISPYPEIGNDVDKASDVVFVSNYLK